MDEKKVNRHNHPLLEDVRRKAYNAGFADGFTKGVDERCEGLHKHYRQIISSFQRKFDEISNQVEVVKVVRCKDCKHWRKTKTDPIILIDYGECCCKNFWDIHLTTSKDFCSYGERKEG